MSYSNPIGNLTTPVQPYPFFTDVLHKTKLPTLFNSSETIAALACAEVLGHPKLDSQVLDTLLTKTIQENLLEDEWFVVNAGAIENLAELLLPQVKNTLQDYYTRNKISSAEFRDFVKTTHDECDYDFLKFVTNIFSKAYLREFKRITKNTNDLHT